MLVFWAGQNGPVQFELLLVAASERDHQSVRIPYRLILESTESIESDMLRRLSHDRHASIKLYVTLHSPRFDYRVRRRAAAPRENRL